jgi:hypothetical protein
LSVLLFNEVEARYSSFLQIQSLLELERDMVPVEAYARDDGFHHWTLILRFIVTSLAYVRELPKLLVIGVGRIFFGELLLPLVLVQAAPLRFRSRHTGPCSWIAVLPSYIG